MKQQRLMIVSGLGLDDSTFDSDRGSWNVTRALRDCLAGQHGLPHAFETEEVWENTANVDVDEAKVNAMVADKDRLLSSPPLVFVEDEGKIWMIDGHHRLRAFVRLGYTEVAGYVIEANNAGRYRVLWNGKRVAPWYEKRKRRR